VNASGAATKLTFDKPTLIAVVRNDCQQSAKLQGLFDEVGDAVRTVAATPMLFLVDRNGRIVWEDLGYENGTAKAVAKAILAKAKG
jgi:hypothetical protein